MNFRKNLPVFVLILISLAVIVLNFKPGTWLTGWDNLHPEFDFLLNIKRSLFAVWQEYQGLGLLGGMGHAADLPRQIILYLLSSFIPLSLLRYFYVSLMLVIGPVGVYFLLKFLFKNPSPAFLGGLFYLLNLATVQIFYVPFEAFVTHYGFLPWLFYIIVRLLKSWSKKILLYFIIVSLISAAQAYVPTLFVVYVTAVFLIALGYLVKNRGADTVKKILAVFAVIFITNAFWVLPFLYFTFTSSHVVGQAYENFMATEDIYLRNKQFGTLADASILKNFWFNFVDLNREKILGFMVLPWKIHLTSIPVQITGYVFFTFIVIGLIRIIGIGGDFAYSFAFLFLFSFTMLANDFPPFSIIVDIFRDKIPLFGQVFRVPFTKFAVLASFSYSILLAFGVYKLYLSRWIVMILSVALIYFSFPVFQGNLFYDLVKLDVPSEYFEVMKFFSNQDRQTRIANFPQFTYWGWNHYLWDYRGSGFLWYGVEQPILDRAFDGYSPNSENYYWEISQAIYERNQKLFENLLEKYQIRWLMVDDNVLTYSTARALYLSQLKEILDYSTKVKLVESFEKVKVYQVELESKPKEFVFLAENLPVVGPSYKWGNYDKGYEENGNYVSLESQISKLKTQNHNLKLKTEESKKIIYYPFRSLFTGRKQEELEFGVKDEGEYFSFTTKIPSDLVGGKLVLSELSKDEVTEYDANDLKVTTEKLSEVYLDGEVIKTSSVSSEIMLDYIKQGNLEIRVPKINGYYSYNLQPTTYNLESKSCDQFNKGELSRGPTSGQLLRLTSIGSSNCLDFDLPNLTQRLGYLIMVENRNVEGKSLLFAVINKNSQRSDLETYLSKKPTTYNLQPTTSYFIQPPMEQFGVGYTLHLDNISIGRVKTVNDLGRITVNPIPYKFLTSLKIVTDPPTFNTFKGQTLKGDIKVDHPNPSFYQITLNSSAIGGGLEPATPEVSLTQTNNTTLVLSQSFDEGWKAYGISCKLWVMGCGLEKAFPFIFAKEIKDHVLVNNWKNGWKIDDLSLADGHSTIIIAYLPQYLEYLGFGLLFLTPLLLVGKRKFV